MAILIGIGVALIYGAGVGVEYALNKPSPHEATPPPHEHCETIKEHLDEGERLIKEALSPDTEENPVVLKRLAYQHFVAADMKLHGPYKM